MRTYYIYILSSGTKHLYVGMTSDLAKRVGQHRAGLTRSHTTRYAITSLVYYEETGSAEAATSRERQLKGWRRAKKLGLVDGFNPEWHDLSSELLTG